MDAANIALKAIRAANRKLVATRRALNQVQDAEQVAVGTLAHAITKTAIAQVAVVTAEKAVQEVATPLRGPGDGINKDN